MGQQQSKDELLFQQVSYGNSDGIKSLHRDGAGLEYMDREGKTPLIAACLNPALYDVSKTLLELGANVNAYRPGRNGGTPLHHAAKRGLDSTVKLLLSHGANALLMNDDCQTPLDIARAKGFGNVVRTIESHICLYSGWLREIYGPGFLEVLAPQLLSRKVWVVVIPCGSRNMRKPFKLELAVYSSALDAQPRLTFALWRASMEEPAFNQADPAVVVSEAAAISRRGRRRRCRPRHTSQTRIKLASVNERDKQQLQQFCSACKGIPQVVHSNFPFNSASPVVHVGAPPSASATALPSFPSAAPRLPASAPPILPAAAQPTDEEDLELSMALKASLQSAIGEGVPLVHTPETNQASSSAGFVGSASDSHPTKGSCMEQFTEEAGPSNSSMTTTDDTQTMTAVPSAPTLSGDGHIHYPSIDSTPVNISSPVVENDQINEDGSRKEEATSCVICFDAPVEGACVPCGHMAGCMSCLNEIKAKKWGCPVCRSEIVQVIRVYSV